VFANSAAETHKDKVHNQFVDRDALPAWAHHCGLTVELFVDGDKPLIELDAPVTWDDGRTMTERASLGQSICVLRHR